jgi:hypothetical protein
MLPNVLVVVVVLISLVGLAKLNGSRQSHRVPWTSLVLGQFCLVAASPFGSRPLEVTDFKLPRTDGWLPELVASRVGPAMAPVR